MFNGFFGLFSKDPVLDASRQYGAGIGIEYQHHHVQ